MADTVQVKRATYHGFGAIESGPGAPGEIVSVRRLGNPLAFIANSASTGATVAINFKYSMP